MLISEGRRAEIRRFYRVLRTNVDKTQLQIESLARLDTGRYWKIENGIVFPTADERTRLARVLKVNEADLPAGEQAETRASA